VLVLLEPSRRHPFEEYQSTDEVVVVVVCESIFFAALRGRIPIVP
jgi:hypothetical protein